MRDGAWLKALGPLLNGGRTSLLQTGGCLSVHRVFEFHPAEPEVIISRVLVDLHQVIDECFPHAQPASQRFARTDFVGNDEPTLTQLLPSEAAAKDPNPAIVRESGQELGTQPPNSPPYNSVPRAPAGAEGQGSERKSEVHADQAEWQVNRGMPVKQTIIGILALILVALLAYLLASE